MPMPRLFGVGLSVLIIMSAFVGQLVGARPAAAQSVTSTSETELRSGPGYDYPALSVVPVGAGLTIDGPPAAEFYPVTVNGQAGWLPGPVLNIVKDPAVASGVGGESAGTAAPVSGWETEQLAPEVPADEQAAVATVPADPAATAPAESAAAPDSTSVPPADPAAVPASDATAATTGDVAATTTPVAEAGSTAAIPADTLAVDASGTDDMAVATTVDQPAEQTGTVVPATTPEPEPAAIAVPAVEGQASVPTGGNLFYAPDTSSGVVFWVPAGSTVWRLGEARNGFVKADYMAMVGWIAADLLTEPVAVTAEVIPESVPTAENLRTPRPGSGMAFASVELTLRAGPSANEAALDTVPAGARVVMTGVMENGFHRVDYRGTLGWVASDYLSTPPNPTATPNADDNDSAFNGSRYERTYSRDEIVAIIYDAADRYGQSRADMLRVAECESALDPYAVHPSGSYGLYQFIRTTWHSTPYGDQNVFNPRANSNAAAWMWSQGRGSEWVCK